MEATSKAGWQNAATAVIAIAAASEACCFCSSML
jgi:hypothetical protein